MKGSFYHCYSVSIRLRINKCLVEFVSFCICACFVFILKAEDVFWSQGLIRKWNTYICIFLPTKIIYPDWVWWWKKHVLSQRTASTWTDLHANFLVILSLEIKSFTPTLCYSYFINVSDVNLLFKSGASKDTIKSWNCTLYSYILVLGYESMILGYKLATNPIIH